MAIKWQQRNQQQVRIGGIYENNKEVADRGDGGSFQTHTVAMATQITVNKKNLEITSNDKDNFRR